MGKFKPGSIPTDRTDEINSCTVLSSVGHFAAARVEFAVSVANPLYSKIVLGR